MSTPSSPLRAPPLNASSMSDGLAQQRNSNGSLTMPPPLTPGSGSVFLTPRGEPRSKEYMRTTVEQLSAALRERKPLRRGYQHEVMWMVQQHYPHHPFLQGRIIPPPPDTLPRLLHLGQPTGQSAQRSPQVSSPNMVPSDRGQPASSGAQRPRGMAIDPALANSSMTKPRNAVPLAQKHPLSGLPRQGAAPFSPSATAFAQSPSQVTAPGISRTPPRLSFTPGSPAAFVFQNDHAIRSPSKPSQYSPKQAQYAPPLTPGLSPRLPGTAGAKATAQQYPAPQIGCTTGPMPLKGVFAAPPSRPASAYSNNGRVQGKQNLNLRSPEVQAMIDARVAEQLRKFTAQRAAQYKEMMGNDYKRKLHFVHHVMEMQRSVNESTVQRPPPPTAAPQDESGSKVAEPTGNKRKRSHTGVEQPQNKRRVIDLTEDNPPSVSPPQAPVKDPPVPTHLFPTPANAEAHAHALEYGVYLPDLDMSTYSTDEVELVSLVHQQDIREVKSRLDPVPRNLKTLVRSAKDMATQIAVPGAGIAATGDISSVELGNVSSERGPSRTASPSVEHSPNQAQASVDEDSSLCASEEPVEAMSESRANLEYELSFLESS